MSLSGHQSAKMKNDEWLTPPEIVKSLGYFDLDPCAPIIRPWETAATHYTAEQDGLSQEWAGRVWLNPPFGSEAVKWLRKLKEHGDGTALIPARTETAMFFETVWNGATAILFLKGRPCFHYVDGTKAKFNSGAPICLIAYGNENAWMLQSCALEGQFIWLQGLATKRCRPLSLAPGY